MNETHGAVIGGGLFGAVISFLCMGIWLAPTLIKEGKTEYVIIACKARCVTVDEEFIYASRQDGICVCEDSVWHLNPEGLWNE